MRARIQTTPGETYASHIQYDTQFADALNL